MKGPIESMDRRTHFFARCLRYLLLALTMIPIGYLFFKHDIWLGFGLSILGTVFWIIEINRGNETEDYIIENYENPLR